MNLLVDVLDLLTKFKGCQMFATVGLYGLFFFVLLLTMYANVEPETLVNITTVAQSAVTTRLGKLTLGFVDVLPSKHLDKQSLIKS